MRGFESYRTTTAPGGESTRQHLQVEHGNTVAKKAPLYARLVIGPTDRLLLQLFRYTVVGGLAFLADLGILVLLTSLAGLHYLASAAIAFMTGLIVNYFLCTAWVFHRRALADRRLEFLLFSGIGLIGLGLNETLMWLLTDLVGLYYVVSKVGATGIVYLWNFLARRFCLFDGSTHIGAGYGGPESHCHRSRSSGPDSRV